MNSLIKNNNPDIYFDDNYGRLYEKFESGKVEIFRFKNEFGEIKNQFIKREIPLKIKGKSYYDIVTPNGYGGPVILECNKEKKNDLILEYFNAFSRFCEKNSIVSEFIRFHPILKNVNDFRTLYDVLSIRKTLGTNLKDYDDPIQAEFSKSCRKNIQKALDNGVTFNVVEKPTDLGEFKQIYYSTMERNNAKDSYYFDDDYFDNILSSFRDNIIIVKALYEDKTIAQGLYFVYEKTIHIHLSGTLSEYLYLSPAYILRYAVTLWGKENGYEMIHHGGGRSNSEEDGLYKFKKGFARNTEFNFYVGKKVWNKEIYSLLCYKNAVEETIDFFPAYRYKKGEIK